MRLRLAMASVPLAAAILVQLAVAQPLPTRDHGVPSATGEYVLPDSVQWQDRLAYQGEDTLPTPAEGESVAPVPEMIPEPAETEEDPFAPENFWYDAFGYYGHHLSHDYEPPYCNACGGGLCAYCGAEWYSDAQLMLLYRNRPHEESLTRGLLVVGTDPNTGLGTFAVTGGPFLSTDTADFDTEPGMRVKLGRFLGFDSKHRAHAIEAVYFGLHEWDVAASFAGTQRQTFLGTDRTGAIVQFDVGELISQFPDIGGFNRADLHFYDYGSNLHNAELNYRISSKVDNSELTAAKDGRWTKDKSPKWLHSVLIGLRYVHIDEEFAFRSRGRIGVNGLFQDISGDWTTKSQNDLIGMHIGGEAYRRFRRFDVGISGKFGVMLNFAEIQGSIRVVDPVFPTDNFALTTDPNNSWTLSEPNVNIAGEFGLQVLYRLLPNTELRAAYDFIWFGGLANATGQFGNHSVLGPSVINEEGFTFFSGPSLGFSVVW